jgi:probable HAF family extracellular repeat protein
LPPGNQKQGRGPHDEKEKDMNSKTLTRIIALTVFAALALPLQLAAQDNAKPHHHHQYHHYKLIDTGTFGGPQSFEYGPPFPRAGVLNNRGTLGGWADTSTLDPLCYFDFPDCNEAHAFQWQNGGKTDLGILPGGRNSQVNWISANGVLTGVADNGQMDPLGGIPELHAVLWENGGITDLGTLPEGGYQSFTGAVNRRGEVVGSAQNTVPDPNSMFTGYGYQTRAFYWKNGVMQDLGTLGTGTDAIAALINDGGQVVGWSYTNSVPSPICASFNYGFALTTSSFIWDNKNGMRDIGGLGGTCTLAVDVNGRGQIVGGSAVTADQTTHPFVWDAATGMTDLLGASDGRFAFAGAINERGEVVGGICAPVCHALLWRKNGGKWKRTNLGAIAGNTFAGSINESGQVVGTCGSSSCAFLWEDGGPIVDLSTLIVPDSGLQLIEARQINDRGEIAISAMDANGNQHAVLLIPCDEGHPGVEGCDYSLVDASAAMQSAAPHSIPNGTQRPPQSRRANRYRIPGRGTGPTN